MKPVLDKLGVILRVAERPEWPGPPSASVCVRLVPQTDAPGSAVVSFGLPLGPGWLDDDRLIRVTGSDGNEIPVFTKPLVRWWIDGRQGSLRSVLVQFEAAFADGAAQEVVVTWDRPRTQLRPALVPVADTQVTRQEQPPAGDGSALAYSYAHPRVLALLPPEWLCASMLAWQQVPVRSNHVARWFDEHLAEHFERSLRNISAADYSAHLFDRPATYVKVYVRSGEAEHLLAARKSLDCYLQHLRPDGFFGLKPMEDVKYVFTEGFALMYMLTGDERYREAIGCALKAWETHTRIEY